MSEPWTGCFWTETEIWDETVKKKRGQPEPTKMIRIWVSLCGADRPEDCTCSTLRGEIEGLRSELKDARRRAKDLEAMADHEMYRRRELRRLTDELYRARRELALLTRNGPK